MKGLVPTDFHIASGEPDPLALQAAGHMNQEAINLDADVIEKILGSLQARYNFNAHAQPQYVDENGRLHKAGLHLAPNARLEGSAGPLRAELVKQMGMPAEAGVHYNEGNLHAFLQKQLAPSSRPIMGVDYAMPIGANGGLSAFLSQQMGQRPQAGVNLNYTKKF